MMRIIETTITVQHPRLAGVAGFGSLWVPIKTGYVSGADDGTTIETLVAELGFVVDEYLCLFEPPEEQSLEKSYTFPELMGTELKNILTTVNKSTVMALLTNERDLLTRGVQSGDARLQLSNANTEEKLKQIRSDIGLVSNSDYDITLYGQTILPKLASDFIVKDYVSTQEWIADEILHKRHIVVEHSPPTLEAFVSLMKNGSGVAVGASPTRLRLCH